MSRQKPCQPVPCDQARHYIIQGHSLYRHLWKDSLEQKEASKSVTKLPKCRTPMKNFLPTAPNAKTWTYSFFVINLCSLKGNYIWKILQFVSFPHYSIYIMVNKTPSFQRKQRFPKFPDSLLRKFVVFVIQLLSRVWLITTPWTAACQASLSFAISHSLLKFMSIESVRLSPSHPL